MTQLINNNYNCVKCPFCESNKICEVGVINYSKPLLFSSNEICLVHRPFLWRCRECFSSFTQNSICENDLEKLYTESNSESRWSSAPFQTLKCPEVVDKLASLFGPTKIVADVGCNTGELLDFAKTFGSKTLGIELSITSREVLESKGHASFSSLHDTEDNSLDIITAFDLVEHLHDVKGFIRVCQNKLKHGGKLILLTGNIGSISAKLSRSRWWYCGYPEHISFVSKKYISGMTGFKLIDVIPTYASVGYKKNLFIAILSLLIRAPLGKFRGLPSIGTDHTLYILERTT
jgi:SAM-dependent methyltransferase